MTGRIWVSPDVVAQQRILSETRTVAIVGASANPSRASYSVYTYLRSSSAYELYLVNPNIAEIDWRAAVGAGRHAGPRRRFSCPGNGAHPALMGDTPNTSQ